MRIESGFITDDGEVILTTMSDMKWDFYCLTDRCFHREHYAGVEDVDAKIRRIVKRLRKHPFPFALVFDDAC